MTDTQQIIKMLGRIERKLEAKPKDEWLTEKQVKEKRDLSKKLLQQKRKDGTLILGRDFRCLETGRKFEYKSSSIESLFTKTFTTTAQK